MILEKTLNESGVLVLTLCAEGKLNIVNDSILKEISLALSESKINNAVKVVVIYGNRDCFAAGADIKELAAKDMLDTINDKRASYWQTIASYDKPIIAAVNGYAFGAGCELAMHCDIVVAGFNAQFAQPEVKLGIMPGAGGTQRLTKTVGKSTAMLMTLTGEPIDAKEAQRLGLVSLLTAPEATLERAVAIANKIARHSPLAVKMIKKSVLGSMETGLSTGLAMEYQSFITLAASEDRNEGIAAFLEKRQANFTGK